MLLLLPLFVVVGSAAAVIAVAVVGAGAGAGARAFTAPTDRDTSKYVYCVARYNIIYFSYTFVCGKHVHSTDYIIVVIVLDTPRARTHTRSPNKRKAHEPNDQHKTLAMLETYTVLAQFHTYMHAACIHKHAMFLLNVGQNVPSSFICSLFVSLQPRFDHTRQPQSIGARDIPIVSHHHHTDCMCVY